MSNPVFLDLFEAAMTTVQTHAVQDVVTYNKEMTPEAKDLWATEMQMRWNTTQAALKEVGKQMQTAIATIRDLQLAKDPDVERLAWQIWSTASAQRCQDPRGAMDAAGKFITYRNELRIKERKAAGLPTTK